tara:strand:+ start:4607 stop:5044 length:438 start_codon:yes stop_codon:yes gene_type:complete
MSSITKQMGEAFRSLAAAEDMNIFTRHQNSSGERGAQDERVNENISEGKAKDEGAMDTYKNETIALSTSLKETHIQQLLDEVVNEAEGGIIALAAKFATEEGDMVAALEGAKVEEDDAWTTVLNNQGDYESFKGGFDLGVSGDPA